MCKIPVLWLWNLLPLSQVLRCFISGKVVRGLLIMTEKWKCILKVIKFISVTFFVCRRWQFFIQIKCLLKIYKRPAGLYSRSLLQVFTKCLQFLAPWGFRVSDIPLVLHSPSYYTQNSTKHQIIRTGVKVRGVSG